MPFAVTVTVATIGFTVMEIIEDREIRAALGTWGRRPFNQLPGRPIEGRSAHAGEGAERAGALRSNIFLDSLTPAIHGGPRDKPPSFG